MFRVSKLYPKLQLSFLERNSAAAVELLERGGADLAIAAHPANLAQRPSLEYLPFANYPFMLICPPKHPLIVKRNLTLADFTEHPLILPGTIAYCRQHFDGLMLRAGLQNKVKLLIESNFPVMLFEYVRMGLGIALTPLPEDPSRGPEWQRGGVVLRNVSSVFGTEPICYVRRKGQFETPYAAALRELLTGTEKSSGKARSPLARMAAGTKSPRHCPIQ